MFLRLMVLGACVAGIGGCEDRASAPPPAGCPQIAAVDGERVLTDGWWIRSSTDVIASDRDVSVPGLLRDGWHPTCVPSTVVGALVGDGTYPDPFPGTQLRSMPGVDYLGSLGFGNKEMSESSPFWQPWWYRTEVDLPAPPAGRHAWLRLEGLNHRADVWLNGTKLADETEAVGTFRRFEYDVTPVLATSGPNALAVKVRAQRLGDLGWNFVDWNPFPPDKAMGLWRPVAIRTTGTVRLRWPQVVTELDGGRGPGARLTVHMELENAEPRAVDAIVRVTVDGAAIAQAVTLAPREVREVTLAPEDHPELVWAAPKLWWPRPLGEAPLYSAQLEVDADGGRSDGEAVRFGVRQVTSELTPDGYRLFKVNGRPVQIRGAGWTPDMLLRDTPEHLALDVAYVRDMNLNAIRLEGKVGFPALYDRADEAGILVMPGWCCCDRWEMWDHWTDEDRRVAAASLLDQARELRGHPSVFVWLNGSDNAPPPDVEQLYLDTLAQARWPNPVLATAAAWSTPLSGPSGVKMPGPYIWVPPVYWSTDTERGGAFGFNTETSMGAAIPPMESLRKFIDVGHHWPIDDAWIFHSGQSDFVDLDVYGAGLAGRYGAPTSVEDYAKKSQLAAYEGVRAMFEAYGRRKGTATGVIQWMLNNAWPGLIWHLYDVYLKPGGGYFGAKLGNEPVHVMYGYDDQAIAVVNHTSQPIAGLTAYAQLLDVDGGVRWEHEQALAIDADSSRTLFAVPAVAGLPKTYLLSLLLRDATSGVVSRNLYWLSTAPDVLDFDQSPFFFTPTIAYADLTGLTQMTMQPLAIQARRIADPTGELVQVTLRNDGARLAFFARVEIALDADTDELVPVRWSDNDVSLAPGETRTIDARLALPPRGTPLVARVEGWNVPHATATVAE